MITKLSTCSRVPLPPATESVTPAKGKSRSLYFSTSVATLRQRLDAEIWYSLGEETRLIVSEQLGDLPVPGKQYLRPP
jgi:hypothetical protein